MDCTHKVKHWNYKLVAIQDKQQNIVWQSFWGAFSEMLMKSTNLEWLGGISMFLFECTRHILQISFAYHECHLRPLYYTVVDISLFSNNKEERQGGLLQLL